MMKTQGIWAISVLLGLTLVVISFFWPSIVGGRRNWSDAQAKDYTNTLAAMHRLNGEVAEARQQLAQPPNARGNSRTRITESRLATATALSAPVDPATASPDRLATELEVVQQRYAKQQAALDAARSHGQNAALVMRWLGLGLAAAGAIGLLSFQSRRGN
ncbi:MAG TPA: hypothetical protein VGJ04_00565 [Pirellulales bacterium]